MTNKRAYAANAVDTKNVRYEPGYVEVIDGIVGAYGRLDDEREATEWLRGCIEIVDDEDGKQRVYYNGKIL